VGKTCALVNGLEIHGGTRGVMRCVMRCVIEPVGVFPKNRWVCSIAVTLQTIRTGVQGPRSTRGAAKAFVKNSRPHSTVGTDRIEGLRLHPNRALDWFLNRHPKSIECLKGTHSVLFVTLYSQQVRSSKKLPNPAPPFRKNLKAQS